MLGEQVIYRWYARRLRRHLAGGPLPGHVGIIMDGNRRWARQHGMPDASLGHKRGAEHAEDVLSWCEDIGIRHVPRQRRHDG
jgi:short-chain Z-isoprenyl diphosphate synthase